MVHVQAQAVDSEAQEMIREAGDAMMLLITRSTWETLVRQGAAEGKTPGEVLGAALRFYLEEHGAPGVVEYLNTVAGGK